MSEFVIVRPVVVTPAMLTSCSVDEPATGADSDPAEWNPATNYAPEALATRSATHKIYERLAPGGIDAAAPESDATKWVEVQPTNRWRLFDKSVGSQGSGNEEIVIVLTPGQIVDTVGVLNADGSSVRVQVADSEFDETKTLGVRVVDDWLEYLTEPFAVKRNVVFQGLPLRSGNVITITISAPGGVARVGEIVLGHSRALGGTRYGASTGILDFSIKETNELGYTELIERPYADTMNVELLVDALRVDTVKQTLAQYRAKPVLWIGAGNLYESLIVYGFAREFEIVIAYAKHSLMSLEIEGLT